MDFSSHKISSKSELLEQTLIEFYKNDNNIKIIESILSQNTNLSLRILDWLVTNYSKKNQIIYDVELYNQALNKQDVLQNFNIFKNYKGQLKAYSKKYFDPFCRRGRIFYNNQTHKTETIPNDEIDNYNIRKDGFITTIGQLNFFRWAITYKIIQYAIKNIDSIEKDMLTTYKLKKNNKSKLKRKELTPGGNKVLQKSNLHTVITFE